MKLGFLTAPLPDLPLEDTPVRATFQGTYPAELRERIVADWHAYGF